MSIDRQESSGKRTIYPLFVHVGEQTKEKGGGCVYASTIIALIGSSCLLINRVLGDVLRPVSQSSGPGNIPDSVLGLTAGLAGVCQQSRVGRSLVEASEASITHYGALAFHLCLTSSHPSCTFPSVLARQDCPFAHHHFKALLARGVWSKTRHDPACASARGASLNCGRDGSLFFCAPFLPSQGAQRCYPAGHSAR